jgi:hypothetical protein
MKAGAGRLEVGKENMTWISSGREEQLRTTSSYTPRPAFLTMDTPLDSVVELKKH